MSEISELDGPELYLALIRKRITAWERAEPRSRTEHEQAEAFTRAFAELDAALRDGGRLPASWAHARPPLISEDSEEDPPSGSILQEKSGTREVQLAKQPGESAL